LEYPDIILNRNYIQIFDFDIRKKLSQNLDILWTSSTQLVPISFKWVEAYSAPVWYACEEGTEHLDILEDEQDDPQHRIYLSDFGLPKCEIEGQILCRHSEDEYAEDHGDLLVDELFLPQVEPGRLQPGEGEQEEDLVQHGQVVHVGHVIVLHQQEDCLHPGVEAKVEDIEIEKYFKGELPIYTHPWLVSLLFCLLTAAASLVWQKLEFELNLASVYLLFLSVGLEGLLLPGAAIEAEATTPQTAFNEKFFSAFLI